MREELTSDVSELESEALERSTSGIVVERGDWRKCATKRQRSTLRLVQDNQRNGLEMVVVSWDFNMIESLADSIGATENSLRLLVSLFLGKCWVVSRTSKSTKSVVGSRQGHHVLHWL